MRSLTTIEFIVESEPMTARGLPHSDIQGSSLLSSYPWLFAAWYVLRRLWSQGIHLVLFHIFDVNCTRNTYGNKVLRAASCVIQHMKVLLYAVFKDRGAIASRRAGSITNEVNRAASSFSARSRDPLKSRFCKRHHDCVEWNFWFPQS